MLKKHETPFSQVMAAHTKADIATRYPQTVKTMDEALEIIAEANTAIKTLMEVRNMINSIIDLKSDPQKAVLRHLDSKLITDAAESIKASQ